MEYNKAVHGRCRDLPMLLALDTTSAPGSAALILPDGRCVAAPGDDPPYGEQLPGSLRDLVAGEGHQLADVTTFAVAIGPGSLTGLRVGIATVQGLAFATGQPCVGVSVFDALAWAWLSSAPVPSTGDRLAIWLDARRNEVFSALLERSAAPMDDAAAVGDLVTVIDAPSVATADERIGAWRRLTDGNGALALCGTRLEPDLERLKTLTASVSIFETPAMLAPAVAEVARREVRHGRTMSPHALHPLYIRRPDVELTRDRARATQVP